MHGLYGGSVSSQESNASANACTPIATKSHGGGVRETSLDRTRNKCATVTMMLAERIIRNDWSVEDEHFFESNHMNVWQTLEFLSGISLRRRYNYEGYSDTNNSIRTLTPSWRRDSFVEKNVSPNVDESSASTTKTSSAPTVSTNDQANEKYVAKTASVKAARPRSGSSVAANRPAQEVTDKNTSGGLEGTGENKSVPSGQVADRGNGEIPKIKGTKKTTTKATAATAFRRRRSKKKKIRDKELDPQYALSPSDYADLIKCTFNLPRISAALERLMGTNVVRLTDRNYMKELRERIEDDYRQNLQKRIRARELKEVERERILIIEGKTKVIPDELADDPIFVVDKKAEIEITKSRAKLKTNREKNAERLKVQGAKWERERRIYEAEEAERIEQLRKQYAEQHELEVQYTNEDARKGMNLLRIHDEEWRPCEQRLKEFLEQERAKMKERSLRVPTPFTSDAKDMQNILRARKKFHETEKRIRKHLEDQHTKQLQVYQQGLLDQKAKGSQGSKELLPDGSFKEREAAHITDFNKDFLLPTDENALVRQAVASDDASDLSSGESFDEGSTISMAKNRYIKLLQADLEHDVSEGLLISKEQYDHLRYEDEKILQLRNARNIVELYELAEEIILGDRIEIDEEEGEEEEEG